MHEASLICEVLDTAFTCMREQSANRVHRVRLSVGALSGAVPGALEFAFNALKEGTPAAEASLEIELIPICFFCPACDAEFASDDPISLCPSCGSWKTEVRQGTELKIVSLEVSHENLV